MPTYQQHIEQAIRDWTADHPVWRHNDKISARELAHSSEVRPPALLGGPSSLRNLPQPTTPAVLKPVHGCSARGVHLLAPAHEGYRELLSGRYMTWEQVTSSALAAKHTARNQALIKRGHPDATRPPWLLEELILWDGEAACDWKIFTFGHEPEVALQMKRGPGLIRVKWWSLNDWSDIGDICPTRGWRYSPRLAPPSNPEAMAEAARKVARQVPTPFVRVDLYEAQDGPVFGEITPTPTGGTSLFVPEWNERLGRAWDAALLRG